MQIPLIGEIHNKLLNEALQQQREGIESIPTAVQSERGQLQSVYLTDAIHPDREDRSEP
jgi:hypothetical protein